MRYMERWDAVKDGSKVILEINKKNGEQSKELVNNLICMTLSKHSLTTVLHLPPLPFLCNLFIILNETMVNPLLLNLEHFVKQSQNCFVFHFSNVCINGVWIQHYLCYVCSLHMGFLRALILFSGLCHYYVNKWCTVCSNFEYAEAIHDGQ